MDNLKNKSREELIKLKEYYEDQLEKQFNARENAKISTMAELLKEMNSLTDMGELKKELSEKGSIKTYLETGLILNDESFFLNLDINILSKFVARQEEDDRLYMYFINKYYKGISVANIFDPWHHIYFAFEEYFNDEMDKGNCFNNIACSLEHNHPIAKEIAKEYKGKKLFNQKMIYIINKTLNGDEMQG